MIVTSEIIASLLPSTLPRVVIHTRTYAVGVAVDTEIVLEPVFIGCGGVSSVVSSSDAGVADCAIHSEGARRFEIVISRVDVVGLDRQQFDRATGILHC